MVEKGKSMDAITLCSLGYANALITNNNKKRSNVPIYNARVRIFQTANGARRESSTRRMPDLSRTYTIKRETGRGS